MELKCLNTTAMSLKHRQAAIDLATQRILITDFSGSQQAKDFTEPANCAGLGRIRHFRRVSGTKSWPVNPLPIDPASKALGLAPDAMIRAQVFQSAVCNWRCWYCFVDFDLLRANPRRSRWMSPADLVDLYQAQPDPPPMIDLTGGQPDLTPEWVLWMMKELALRGLDRQVYLWSDDNLSNDYFWTFLSDADRDTIAAYPLYGRVCCFKGFSADSFHFNTCAEPALFDRQFDLMARLLSLGIDLYAYVTLTTPSITNLSSDMARFLDRLQALHPKLPLRTVPLEIRAFTPVKARLNEARHHAMGHQVQAVEAWQRELEHRYSLEERTQRVTDFALSLARRTA